MGNAGGSDPDVALMLAVKAGDSAAFDELVARHAAYLVNFFYRQVGHRDLAEDLAQETFLKVYRARDGYRPTARFKAWLLTIATNLALNKKRYEKLRFHLSLDTSVTDDDGEQGFQIPDRGGAEPASAFERDEMQERVRVVVQGLPANQRIAVILHRFEGLSYAEIATAMDLTEKAVKSLLNRAKENLRTRLQHEIKDYLAIRGKP
jgi:RNA polymerase sigma-70 factor (ECF subfamily)